MTMGWSNSAAFPSAAPGISEPHRMPLMVLFVARFPQGSAKSVLVIVIVESPVQKPVGVIYLSTFGRFDRAS